MALIDAPSRPRSSYTGVYRRGGPTNVDDVFDLASFLDRDKSAAAAAAGAPGGTPAPAGRERGTPMSGRWGAARSLGRGVVRRAPAILRHSSRLVRCNVALAGQVAK